ALLTGIPSETGHLARAYNNRGICEEKSGNADAAFADYNKAIELDPLLETAYGNRAWLYETLGKKKEAYADYKKAADLGYRPAIYWLEQHEMQAGAEIADEE
ncbi:MAG: tetratricopeptide repeat protein, partial [Chlorobiales bacterium]|nr:tetratricopeptide repeat protein [Chlorobiales bacterium]